MDIIIGKEGNQPFPIKDMAVSRRHAVLHVGSDGRLILEDNNSTNGTYVRMLDGNFQRVTNCRVEAQTVVRLGNAFVFQIGALLKKKAPATNPVDISPLKRLYENYNKRKVELEQKQAVANNLRMLMTSLSMVGTLAGLALGNDIKTKIYIGGGTLALGFLLFGICCQIIKTVIREKNNNEMTFRNHYRCPKCHYPFSPTKIYDNILAEGMCPKCKSKLYEK